MTTKTAAHLPLPSISLGGFMYRRESFGALNGAPVPRSENYPSARDSTDRRAEARELLDTAPVGAVYEWEYYPDPDQDPDWAGEVARWVKTPDGWVEQ